MFPDPLDEAQAKERLFFEPLVELVQHKASSECRFDRLLGRGVATEANRRDRGAGIADVVGNLST